jgi:hypothetical protein
VIRRQLNYRNWPASPPQEKGIDVQVAVDLIHAAFTGQYDALVLFSSDTDLLPALETVVRHKLGHVEVACWSGFKPLRFPGGNFPEPGGLGSRYRGLARPRLKRAALAMFADAFVRAGRGRSG